MVTLSVISCIAGGTATSAAVTGGLAKPGRAGNGPHKKSDLGRRRDVSPKTSYRHHVASSRFVSGIRLNHPMRPVRVTPLRGDLIPGAQAPSGIKHLKSLPGGGALSSSSGRLRARSAQADDFHPRGF